MFQYKILKIFNKQLKIKMILMFLFMFSVSFIELLSIGSILPIFTIIFNQEYLLKVNDFLNEVNIVNIQFENHNDLIFFSLISLFLVFTIKNIFLMTFQWVNQKFAKDLITHLSLSLYRVFINQPYEFYFNIKSSDLIRDINSEPSGLIKNLFTPSVIIIMETITLIGLISFLIFFYGVIAGVALITTLGIVGITLYLTRSVVEKWGEVRYQFETKRIKSITQPFDNIKDIILKKKIDFFFRKFKKFVNLVTNASMHASFYRSLPKILIEQLIIILFIIYFFYYYNFQSVDKNFFSKLIFLGTILIRIIPGLIRLSTSYQTIKFAKTPSENIYKFFNLNKQIVKDINKEVIFDNTIEFSNVSYKFQGYKKHVLKSLCFKINKNQSIGIVGKTGSGKTTLLDIFLGLLKPTSGKILIDNKDFTFNLNQKGWHRKIGYISQNVTLIDDSIQNNIALGVEKDEINKEWIEDALKKANLKKFVDNLPEGIETIVGEKGVKLSGGQIQRIGIARALYSDPEILCLDEATSSLDYQTENEILKTIISIKKNKTVIIIAHRLKTIENCDEIIEMSDGKINKILTPDEYLKNYVN